MNKEGDWSFLNGLENIKHGFSNVFQGISNMFTKQNETEQLPFVSGRRSKFLRSTFTVFANFYGTKNFGWASSNIQAQNIEVKSSEKPIEWIQKRSLWNSRSHSLLHQVGFPTSVIRTLKLPR